MPGVGRSIGFHHWLHPDLGDVMFKVGPFMVWRNKDDVVQPLIALMSCQSVVDEDIDHGDEDQVTVGRRYQFCNRTSYTYTFSIWFQGQEKNYLYCVMFGHITDGSPPFLDRRYASKRDSQKYISRAQGWTC